MPVSLSKGGNLSLSKEAPGLKKITVGLGWQARATDGQPFDLDASAFMLTAEGKVQSDAGFIFYNQPKSAEGSVHYLGDNRTGDADGDDEQITVDLDAVPAAITKVAFSVTIHDAVARAQSFGQVSNAFIRVVNQDGGVELARYDLTEDYAGETALIFGELYRHNGEWKFKAVGQGYNGGLAALAKGFGVDLG